MNKYLKLTREGFTLVELMIVVAIIGVLASIAVPQYKKFQAKARQSEVRIQLGGTYTVENTFAAENNTYTSCLGQIGYNRDGAKFYYTIGFDDTTAKTTKCQPGDKTAGDCQNYAWSYDNANKKWIPAPNATACTAGALSTVFEANIAEPGTSVTTKSDLKNASIANDAFVISAAGNILSNAKKIDLWTIDQGKQTSNVQSGLAN